MEDLFSDSQILIVMTALRGWEREDLGVNIDARTRSLWKQESHAVGLVPDESLGSISDVRSRAPNIDLPHLSFWISSRGIYFVYER